MSEPKIISPLLDGFTLGASISEHHGVICCPAIKENTNKKYIVKMINVPATQAQFDALLLAGAYKDPSDAMEYFRQTGEGLLKEAEVLKQLSKIEGFLPYDGWQMEPITRRRLGYEVYLVGSYKRSLDKYMRNNAFTHLEALNLSLDLCSALSICRQFGYLYLDLKPSNIYVSEKKEFRIGDLGFLELNALRYASFPERYFSPYTPPEMRDPMTPMNLTVDTYAVGMLLYQLYNDGQLPISGTEDPVLISSPCHADYELAEIIMKAIHPDPEQRWADPKELGKTIAAYMHRNSVSDIPITPFLPVDVKPEDIVPVSPQNLVEDTSFDDEDDVVASVRIISEEEIPDVEPKELIEEPAETVITTEETFTEETVFEETDVIVPSANDAAADQKHENPNIPETTSSAANTAENAMEENSDTLEDISEEVAQIITKANDIIAHEIPEEITRLSEKNIPDPFAFAKEDMDEADDAVPEYPLMEEETDGSEPVKRKNTKHYADTTGKKKFRKFIRRCFTILLLCCAALGGFWYYENIYLQTVDAISLSGTQDQITVLVDTGIEESKLSILCVDENGKRRSEAIQGGKAVFSDLQPSTQYTIQIAMSGFHKLVGNTSEVYTTDAMTQIVSFQAVAGSENGSVQLNFTVNGNDPDFWNIRYSAEGEEQRLETVTGHSAMITGLTMGKVYTFTLDGGKNFDLSGETSVQYLASRLILAENLTVTSSNGSDMTVHWNSPGDVVVESWHVRCYDGYGFEEQKTVTETNVLFMGMTSDSHYTVEVTASGMTQPSSIYISPDPIVLSDFQIEENAKTGMKITWQYTGVDPEGGWMLHYTVDGAGGESVSCTKASAVIPTLIPGANYKFVLEAADSRTIFNNVVLHQSGAAEAFTEHNFDRNNVSINLLKTPLESDWSVETINADVFTNMFGVGESASMVFQSASAIYVPSNKTKILYLFRDSYGNVLPDLITEGSCTWKSIWSKGDVKTGELDIPRLPEIPGNYVLELYFNGGLAAQLDIIITD